MKNNSGSALTSVVVVFLLVTLIGVPLLGMTVWNYRLREYDSGIKEAEYKNEIIMDRISNIIRNCVIQAISDAKSSSTSEIGDATDFLMNEYRDKYNLAYSEALNNMDNYDAGGKIIDSMVYKDIALSLKEKFKEDLANRPDGDKYKYLSKRAEDITGILNLVGEIDDETKTDTIDQMITDGKDLANAKIDDEKLNQLCNAIFQEKYQEAVLNETESIFAAIYGVDCGEFKGEKFFGDKEYLESSGERGDSYIKVASKYGDTLNVTYEGPSDLANIKFNSEDKLLIGVETNYKLGSRVPLTTLSATFVIKTPEFNDISAIESVSAAFSTPVLDYSLIVGGELIVNGNLQVDGNVLAGANNSEISEPENKNGIFITSGSKLVQSTGRIATSGDIIIDTDVNKVTNLTSGTNPIYYRNLYLGKPGPAKDKGQIDVIFNGDVLAKDDLEINVNDTVNVTQTAGSYIGYNDENDEGPDSSSAIVINSSVLNKIKIKLGDLYLAGRAFIDGVNSTLITETSGPRIGERMIYKTGESISIKGNYIAYQSPLFETKEGKYDVNMVQFSPYFMSGKKDGINDTTNIAINLVDCFYGEDNRNEEVIKRFDREDKWKYFMEYFNQDFDQDYDPIKVPAVLTAGTIKLINGVGVFNSNDGKYLEEQSAEIEAQDFLAEQEEQFEQYTLYFGYMPKDEALRKKTIEEWISFNKKEINSGNLYLSVTEEQNKTLNFGTAVGTGEQDGIIIHKGNLKITGGSNTHFNGTIIVTGDLEIDGDTFIASNKQDIANVVIQNYFGAEDYVEAGILEEGELFNIFKYDGSGGTYEAINIAENSNMIDINELIGITDWKKQSYGRL